MVAPPSHARRRAERWTCACSNRISLQALHWITAGALCFLLPFVENFPPGPVRTFWYMAHESMGISVFLLILMRLTWRWRHAAPAYPPQLGRTMRAAAWINHALLYAVLLIMPVTGYMMAGNGQDVPFFRLFFLPGFPPDEGLGLFANTAHVAGQFALYALVILHVAATVFHVAIRRGGMLERMLPPQQR
jgi:cytochrome b561